MSMPPADPPPSAPDPAADLTAPAGSTPARRRAAVEPGGGKPSVTAEWTTIREVPLECTGCGAGFVVSYKYRFVEGLAATVLRCPGCGRGREYYLPVNAFDVSVAAVT